MAAALTNRSGNAATPPAGTEAELMRPRIGLILSLTVSVAAFAAQCLSPSPAAANAAPAVEIRFTPRPPGGEWAVAETANFRIFHNETREVAEKAARLLEASRVAACAKWFGEPEPTWTPRCDVYLYATAEDYSLATNQPPQVAGHSTIDSDGDRVTSRRIDVHCDDPNMFVGVLPHETTHVVLAGRFGVHRLPHWVDEGMAVLSEPRGRIDLHLNNLPRYRRDDALYPVGELMRSSDYPDDGRRMGAFYAESVSLVEFLCRYKHKGPRVFARFLRRSAQRLRDGPGSDLRHPRL